MCSPNPFYYWGFHIVRHPFLSEIRQSTSHYPLFWIAGAVTLYLIGSSLHITKVKTIEKRRAIRNRIIIFFIVLVAAFVGTTVGAILTVFSCSFDVHYYSSAEFIAAVDNSSDSFYNLAIFYQGGLLDISKTGYEFKCQNDECKRRIQLTKNDKKLEVLERTQGAFYKCKDSKVIYIVTVDDNLQRPNFYLDKSSVMSACTNQ